MQNSNSGNELVLLASTIAILIAEKSSTDNISILATLFTAIGDNLALIATKRSLNEAENLETQVNLL